MGFHSVSWANTRGAGALAHIDGFGSGMNTAAVAQSTAESRVAKTISGAHFYADKPENEKSPLDSSAYRAARSRASVIREAYAKEWKEHVLNPQAEVSANALTKTVRPVIRALLELGPGGVDLSDLPHGRVNGVHLAVVLRATLRRQVATPGWEEALEKARYALARDRIDEAKVLSGLLNDR